MKADVDLNDLKVTLPNLWSRHEEESFALEEEEEEMDEFRNKNSLILPAPSISNYFNKT